MPAVKSFDDMGAIQFPDNPEGVVRAGQDLLVAGHQTGKAGSLAGRRIQGGLEGFPSDIVENEQAAVGEGFGCRSESAVDQEFADGFILRARCRLDHFFGGRRYPQVDTLGFRGGEHEGLLRI